MGALAVLDREGMGGKNGTRTRTHELLIENDVEIYTTNRKLAHDTNKHKAHETSPKPPSGAETQTTTEAKGLSQGGRERCAAQNELKSDYRRKETVYLPQTPHTIG